MFLHSFVCSFVRLYICSFIHILNTSVINQFIYLLFQLKYIYFFYLKAKSEVTRLRDNSRREASPRTAQSQNTQTTIPTHPTQYNESLVNQASSVSSKSTGQRITGNLDSQSDPPFTLHQTVTNPNSSETGKSSKEPTERTPFPERPWNIGKKTSGVVGIKSVGLPCPVKQSGKRTTNETPYENNTQIVLPWNGRTRSPKARYIHLIILWKKHCTSFILWDIYT